ncbi:MAG: hypothetical protein Fur003_4350 [Candidatus Dojkabacteria bacterium]
MPTLLQLLQNPTVWEAVAAMITAGALAFALYSDHINRKQQNSDRINAIKPIVVIKEILQFGTSLRDNSNNYDKAPLIIKNIGSGPALNLKVSYLHPENDLQFSALTDVVPSLLYLGVGEMLDSYRLEKGSVKAMKGRTKVRPFEFNTVKNRLEGECVYKDRSIRLLLSYEDQLENRYGTVISLKFHESNQLRIVATDLKSLG